MTRAEIIAEIEMLGNLMDLDFMFEHPDEYNIACDRFIYLNKLFLAIVDQYI